MKSDDATTAIPPFLTGVTGAMRARPHLVVLPIVVFAVAAFLAGLLRGPVYTATARVTVADVATASGTTPGFQDGVENVANAVSQMITAGPVVDAAAEVLGEAPSAVAGRLSATPVPATPFVEVSGTGEDTTHAVETANAGAQGLIDYMTALAERNPTASALEDQYRTASRDLASAETRLRAAEAAFASRPDPATRRRLVNATADRDSARLRADAVGSVYQASLRDGATVATPSIVTRASAASSDRLKTAATFLIVALIAGAMLGVALAVLAAGDRARRTSIDEGPSPSAP
ncbi:MAG: hypothetical protein R2878_12910 [Thermoleophilia bacterium]